jgi:hypothetical protein
MPRRNPGLVDPQIIAELMQMPPAVKRQLLGYASRRARMIADAGYPVASDEASILLADAIADTLTGAVIWDRRVPLGFHLRSVVRVRTSNQIKSARRRAHLPLEVLGDGDVLAAAESIGGDHTPARPDTLLERAQVARKLYRNIRDRAMRDAALTALLDAYTKGLVKPREVMKRTGLSRGEFVNARRRLDRMLASLPADLRHAALATMREPPPISGRRWIDIAPG